ncbi:MAG: anaerobic ribonucleoside-triphosphate reductase activating protein [Leptotrichiaceae bacterium]|jgi:pyruvate formate lyase activating enzyme|nr:anaerobic ribonucleoside-triphosphate reductase activating protein [Leptotrichiaceae bacterium]MBP9595438.1 anaerobic ribonucleoside-triphosphate reductase activating protein [Fusobacteriaceae bacterium]MBU9917948.1 anaerobic ribonucleoside-triphosphate reductase activating protein [Fusobacteriaceae bacterium]
MKILGLAKTSTVDYPGKLVSTIFLGGCNFDCEYCHNRALIKPEASATSISEEELLAFLQSRKSIIEGLCITGGEATIWGEKLINLVRKIKIELGKNFLIKLDTNGSNPKFLKSYAKEFDYIAMDFKTIDYKKHLNFSDEIIKESLDILKTSKVPYEIRITMYPPYINQSDFEAMAKVLKGINKVILQKYKPVELGSQKTYSILVLEEFKEILIKTKINTEIR